MNWFKKSGVVQRNIILVRSTSLRLDEWRRDPSLVKRMIKLQESQTFAAMVAVLRNESPMNYMPPTGANHDDRIAHACRAEGYQLALNNIEALAQFQKPAEVIESEFKPEFQYTPEKV